MAVSVTIRDHCCFFLVPINALDNQYMRNHKANSWPRSCHMASSGKVNCWWKFKMIKEQHSKFVDELVIISFKLTLRNKWCYFNTFMLMVSFYTPWKYQKISGFLMFSGAQKETIDIKCVKCIYLLTTYFSPKFAGYEVNSSL